MRQILLVLFGLLAGLSGAGAQERLSDVHVVRREMLAKLADLERDETVFRFRGAVANRLPVPVRSVVVAIEFASFRPDDPEGPADLHRVVARLEQIEARGLGEFQVEYRTGVRAYSRAQRLDREGVESFELVLEDAAAVRSLAPHLGEKRMRSAYLAALVAAARDRPGMLASALEEANQEAPPDRYSFALWLDPLLAEARRTEPGLDLAEFLERNDLQGADRERYGAVYDSFLARSFLLRALATHPVDSAAGAVLAFVAPFSEVPAAAVEFFRALGEPAYPALAEAMGHPDRFRAAEEILWRIGVDPPVRLLDASDPAIRIRVAEAFGRGRYEESLVRLGSLGSGDDREVARAGARAVRAIGGRNALALVALLFSPYPEVRSEAEAGLVEAGSAAAPALRHGLEGLGVAPDPAAATSELRTLLVDALRADRSRRIGETIAEGEARFQAGEVEEALAALDGVARIDADHSGHLPLLGRVSLEAGKRRLDGGPVSSAVEALRRAILHHPQAEAVRIPLYRAERSALVEKLAAGEEVDLEAEEAAIGAGLGRDAARGLVADALDRAAVEWEARGRLDRAVLLLEEARSRRATPDVEGHLGRVLVSLGEATAAEEGLEAPNPSFDRLLDLDWAGEERSRVAAIHVEAADREIEAGNWSAAERHLARAALFAPAETRLASARRELLLRRHGLVGLALLALGLATLLAARGTRP